MPIGQENRGMWMRRRLEGWSYGQIAKEAHVSRQRVQQVLSPPKEIRAFVAKRSEYRCQQCHTELGLSGHVHHANGDATTEEEYEKVDELVYLCMPCHRNVHGIQGGKAQVFVNLQLRVPPELYEKLAAAVNAYEDRGEKTSLNRLAITWLEKGGEFELTT